MRVFRFGNKDSAGVIPIVPLFKGREMRPGYGFPSQISGLNPPAKRLLWTELIDLHQTITTVSVWPDGTKETSETERTTSTHAWQSQFHNYEGPFLPGLGSLSWNAFSLATYTYRGTDPVWLGVILESVVQNMMKVHDFGFYFLCLKNQKGITHEEFMWTNEAMEEVVADFFDNPHETHDRMQRFDFDQEKGK